jgi:hypothetical protein
MILKYNRGRFYSLDNLVTFLIIDPYNKYVISERGEIQSETHTLKFCVTDLKLLRPLLTRIPQLSKLAAMSLSATLTMEF